MKKLIILPFLMHLFALVSYGATVTWTGATNIIWQEAGNWNTGSIPTSGDDVIIPDISNTSISSVGNISINSLRIDKTLSLMGLSGIFSVNSIQYNNVLNSSLTSSIKGFFQVTVTSITLDNPDLNRLSLEIQNAVLNGVVNTNAQSLILTGTINLNSGCSFTGGLISGNGVEFRNTIAVNVNAPITISSAARFVEGIFQGSGSISLGNGNVFFGGGTLLTAFQVPVTINSTLATVHSFNCSDAIFANTLTLNAGSGSISFASVGPTARPLEFKNAINSNKSFSIQGNTGSLVKFTDATLNIVGTTFRMQVYSDASITNTVFNDDVIFAGNTDFLSGTFNTRLDIGASFLPSKTFKIKGNGIKQILGFTEVAGTLNWEAGNIEKGANTQIIINSTSVMNITGTSLEFVPASDPAGLFLNEGTINSNVPAGSFCNFNIRTWHRTGTINVNSGSLRLKSVEMSSAATIASGATLTLGGFNNQHYIQSGASITGTGALAFGLGAIQINQAFSVGNLSALSVFGGAYLFGSGSIIVPTGRTMFLHDAQIVVPVTVDGALNMTSNTFHIFANTITVNGSLNWSDGVMGFNSNGKININTSGIFNVSANDKSTDFNVGVTNIGIQMCGRLNLNVTGTTTITVPVTFCPPYKVTGTGTITLSQNGLITDIISPGTSPGTLTINPSITSTSTAIYEMEIIGNQYDRLLSTGNIELGGTLKLSLTSAVDGRYIIFDGASITPSSQFATIQYSVNGGVFSTVKPSNIALETNYANGTVTVVIGTGGSINLQLSAKIFLQGPYNATNRLMNDDLRTKNLIPSAQPYSTITGFTHIGGGTEIVTPSVLAVTGNDAIVDWVFIQLRDKNNAATVLSTRAALLQRDGDIVDVDGTSAVTFNIAPDNYYVAIRHRNHLGMRTANAVSLPNATMLDFTTVSTPSVSYGINPQKDLGSGKFGLYMGNVIQDGLIKYSGSSNDRLPILTKIGGTNITATVNGYFSEDCNLDGIVKYSGSSNDRLPILTNIGGTNITETITEQF
jgi:hypothetical protein